MKKILMIALKNTLLLYLFVVIIDSFFYTASFIFVGVVKRDIFNKLLGKEVFFNFNIFALIALAALTPLTISIVKQLNSYLLASSQQNIANNLKEYVYKIVYKIPINGKLDNNSGEFITRFRDDVADIVSFFTEIFNQVPKLFLSIAQLIIMFKISSFFTFVSIVPLFIIIVLVGAVQGRLVKNKELARKSTDKTTEFLGDVFNSVDVIKLSSKIDNFLDHYKVLCNNRAKQSIRDAFFQNFMTIISSNLMYFALGVILFFSNNAIKGGTFSIGDFVLYEFYFWFLSESPTIFSSVFSRYKQMMVAKRRINQFEELASEELSDSKIREIGNESIDGLEICWNSQEFHVKNNELCVINGKNASGKSFLLKNLFENSNEYGTFKWIINKKYKDNLKLRPPKVCYLSQTPGLISDSIQNNICMGMEYNEKKMHEILEIVNLSYEIEKGILGLDKFVGNSGDQLSGGQKKRLALARLLYREPDVLLLDDITSGLDVVTEQKVIKNLKDLKNKIIVIASNSSELNKYADKVISISR